VSRTPTAAAATEGTARRVRWAAVAFALTSVYTTVVSARERLPGRPLGIGVPLSVPVGLLFGWGSAVAAPWPMPVGALVAARRASHPEIGARASLACALIGIGGVLGLLMEPNTFDVRAHSRANRLAIVTGFLTTGALASAGLAAWRAGLRARRG
jgi:hypothetical protein